MPKANIIRFSPNNLRFLCIFIFIFLIEYCIVTFVKSDTKKKTGGFFCVQKENSDSRCLFCGPCHSISRMRVGQQIRCIVNRRDVI